MARTAVAYSSLVANSNLTDVAGTTIDGTNHHVINSAKPERTLLRVTNTDGTDRTITVKAGNTNPPAVATGLGDLTVTVAATTGVQWIGPFESGRFLNSDGTMYINVGASLAGKITAFLVPKSC